MGRMDLYSAVPLVRSHVTIVRSTQTSFTIPAVADYVVSCNASVNQIVPKG